MAENLLKGGVLLPRAPTLKIISKRLIQNKKADSFPIFNSKNLNRTIHFFIVHIKEEDDDNRFACVLVNLAVWIKVVA